MTAEAGRSDYESLFPELWRKAYVVAYQVLGSQAQAEDAAQEAMAKAYSWWGRINRSPHGWVARTAYTQAIDIARRRVRSREVLGDDDVERPGRDPRLEDRMDLTAAIERLPRRQREVIVLRYLADQSEADTAAALGMRITTVRKHAQRGLASLGGHLATEMREA
ncbi:sigma-70 family RNA polymerase sigma factor [Kineosporia sp. J2-2]|uniref:Sigma-70 family RNA polymerase sigma factor n=1 Tax=Kineosporia corallincola TaxID=2835133 RepID=A0ABS5TQQ6_9ACTN|nr:sigma-70 family RNA polymerase sigma factor [Kineosporia corallincola]MBT0772661.1 sigma-70 family RNA polymerase sigma factor [Kineosporia corallincola]